MNKEQFISVLAKSNPPLRVLDDAERVKVVTPFLYPDGSSVLLYVRPGSDENIVHISDDGEAIALAKRKYNVLAISRKNSLLIEEMCATLGTSVRKGCIHTTVNVLSGDVLCSLLRTAQAAGQVVFFFQKWRGRRWRTTT